MFYSATFAVKVQDVSTFFSKNIETEKRYVTHSLTQSSYETEKTEDVQNPTNSAAAGNNYSIYQLLPTVVRLHLH